VEQKYLKEHYIGKYQDFEIHFVGLDHYLHWDFDIKYMDMSKKKFHQK